MKILAVSHSCVADVNQQLYVALADAGARVELVVPARWNDAYARGRTPQILPAARFPVHQLPVVKAGNLILHFYRAGLGKALRAARPDVVFIDEEPGSLAMAQVSALCARRGVPLVAYTKQNILKSYPPPFSWIEKSAYKRARAIAALSPEVREVLRAKGFTGPAPLLAHGCDLSLFHAAPNLELREELGLHSPTIGYLGRLVPQKGLTILVEAAAILRAKKRDFQVLMMGAGEQETALRELIARRDLDSHFVWTGAVPHHRAGDYLRCLDVFALPSLTRPNWKEQFGRVLIEAMACGVAVAGSNSGYIPTLIEETGGGLIFEENNPTDCARALETLLCNPQEREKLARSGAESVRARFTYEAIGAQLLQILQTAV